MGLRVLLAEDAFKALGLVGEAVDLAIVDTQMPGMHGFDLVHALRILQPRVRVLLLAPRGSLSDERTHQRTHLPVRWT
jgi:DNA-binding response OmpR family regulator